MRIIDNNHQQITLMEKEILKHASRGARNRKIASQMYISQDTVKAHMSVILKKLGAENRTHAIYIAMRDKIIE